MCRGGCGLIELEIEALEGLSGADAALAEVEAAAAAEGAENMEYGDAACGASADATRRQGNCPAGQECRKYGLDPRHETVSFDTILHALTTIFQAMTLEGWCDIMYITAKAVPGPIAYVYSISLVLLGSFFALNLLLGAPPARRSNPGHAPRPK